MTDFPRIRPSTMMRAARSDFINQGIENRLAAVSSLSTKPGLIEVTLTPVDRRSTRRDSKSVDTQALLAE